ncbi:adenylate/guanylate cyclase domain-containing protein [Nevskia sp.]|uniref:adenylate/guanylate cyclase domain-containing protein n=1 Tax=Nevskia sp. TaxID=1929292 RepID=UPI0025F5FF55|nr:adenylate/guanylate cyclase domain-containing protein [Nevskia sp.]
MVRISLDTWLSSLPLRDDGHLLIGASGHLRLSPAEQASVTCKLRDEALPALIGRARPRQISLVTGLAPGADLLFKQVISQWLAEAGIAFDTVALLPVPVPVLIDDWVAHLDQQATALAPAQIEAVRADIGAQLARCAVIVDLVPTGMADPRLADAAFRQRQYRQLAACLAEQSDLLLAILRPGHAGLPGGVAEVVDWRQRPARIPAEFSTLHLRRPTSAGRPLLIIDPAAGAPDTAPDREDPLLKALAACRAALKAGNYLLCHDLAARAKAEGLQSRELDYVALLSLANAGSTQLAMRRFRELGIGSGADDHRHDDYDIEEWLALKGRLLKDLALAAAPDRAAALFVEAGRVYAQAFEHAGGYFPGINAATMLLLGNRPDEALPLARKVLETLAAIGDSDRDNERYYLRATEAEAALLLGDDARAGIALAAASACMRGNVNARSRTRAQLRLICRQLGRDEHLLDALALPPVLFLPERLPDGFTIARLPSEASFVCGALNGPQELAITEHFLGCGVRVHLVLPAAREPLLARWQQRHGPDRAERLKRCLDGDVECSIAQGFLDDEDRWCAAHISATACGLSRLEARRLGARWQILGDDDAVDGSRSPPAVDIPGRRSLAADGTPIARRFIGTLFADFAGYSRISDAEQPMFQSAMIGTIADALREYRAQILLQHTWGDAVHVVTVDAETAARIADRIHGIVEARRGELGGMLAKLELRLSAHYAPAYEGVDPVEGTPTYFGSQMSFAARIEPVTPPGMIFVTEAFAARLMLEAPDRYAAEYAGEIELAKRYGKYRLYSLRRGDIGI